LLPNPNPIFQLPGSPKQSDSSALDFEVSVLQCVKALVRLITGILQIVKTRCTGIQPHLQCIRIGLSHFVLELRDLLEGRELLDRALQFQRLLAFRRPAPPGSISLLRSQDPLPVLAPAEQALILLPFQSTTLAIPSCVPDGSVKRRWLLAPAPNEAALLPLPVGLCSWPTSYPRPPGCVAPRSVPPFAHRPAVHADGSAILPTC